MGKRAAWGIIFLLLVSGAGLLGYFWNGLVACRTGVVSDTRSIGVRLVSARALSGFARKHLACEKGMFVAGQEKFRKINIVFTDETQPNKIENPEGEILLTHGMGVDKEKGVADFYLQLSGVFVGDPEFDSGLVSLIGSLLYSATKRDPSSGAYAIEVSPYLDSEAKLSKVGLKYDRK